MNQAQNSAANAAPNFDRDKTMKNNGDYNGMLVSPAYSGEVVIHIDKDRLVFQTSGGALFLDFALIAAIHIANFRVRMETIDGDFEISQLGYDFDGFYKEFYRVFCDRSQEALFVDGAPLLEAAGEFAYQDILGSRQGTALLRLFEDCVLILPPDDGGRRIPLCFAEEITRENYTIKIVLDTGEHYELVRLGRRTDSFFDLLTTCRQKAKSRYAADLAALDRNQKENAGEIEDRYRNLTIICGENRVFPGVFAPVANDPDETEEEQKMPFPFWFTGIHGDRAAVELVTGEKTATYLYRFSSGSDDFLSQLRHAMESVKDHREVIYTEDISPEAAPLYAMSLRRSGALYFLRKSMAGRLIHNESWPERVAAFFQ